MPDRRPTTPERAAQHAIEPFVEASSLPVYRAVNERLVELVAPDADSTLVDIGCGTGLVLALALERAPLRDAIGADPDPAMVNIARRRLGDRARVEQCDVLGLPSIIAAGSVDVVTAANCVHLFEDIPASLAAIAAVLAPGGRFGMNTAFYAGSAPESDRPMYGRLLLEAKRLARSHVPNGPSTRTGRGRAVRRELTVDYFEDAVAAAGLRMVATEQITVTLPASFVIDLVATPMFAGSVLPAVPIEVAVDAMRGAATKLAADVREIRRSWLYLVACKRGE